MSTKDIIHFGRSRINALRNEEGLVESVSINDICLIIRKPRYLMDGTIERLCSSLDEISEGLYYAPISDALSIVNSVRKSKNRKEFLVKFTQFLRALQYESTSSIGRTEESTVIPVIYRNNEFKAKEINGRLMFNVTDMAKTYDRVPSEWLNLASTKRLMKKVVERGDAPNTDCLSLVTQGRWGQTWLDHTLLIEFGRSLSPEFGIWCDAILMKLFTEGRVYMRDVTPERMKRQRFNRYEQEFLPPSTYDDAVQLCQEQDTIIREALPKIEYYDEQVEQSEWFTNSFIANELHITIRALNSFLEEDGIQIKRGGKWELTEEFKGIPLKTVAPYDNPFASNPHNVRSVWTHYGREYIHERWKLKHGK